MIFITVALIYLIKLFFLQVLDHDYKVFARNNVLRYITLYPARGLIYDRKDELLVYNEAAYDLMVVPRLVKNPDTNELCSILDIDRKEFERRLEKAKRYSPYKSSLFLEQISKEDYGYLEEKLFRFPGFYVQARTLRKYPKPIAAHILGYIGEVSPVELKSSDYYKQGDYIGKSGIEKVYESILRGNKGMEIVMVDVFNRVKGSYQEGKYDTLANAGKNLKLTIDAELQACGEKLMSNKIGSIVAIEPASGEILCMVSSPSYDPNLLIGRVRSGNFARLSRDTLKPLFNRPTLAQYPPGSTFKLVNALIGLHEGVIIPEIKFFDCDGPESSPIACSHYHYLPVNLMQAIEQSCNPYFWRAFKRIIEQDHFSNMQEAYNNWRNHLLTFNFGKRFGNDILNQRKGNVPADSYYNHYYGEKGWRAITIRSLAIGQGEIELTPLQLANFTAILANRGFYYVPHLIKSVEGSDHIDSAYLKRHHVSIEKKHFDPVIEGMRRVFSSERASVRFYKIEGIEMCGKTGTSQNPHGEDHSVFIAFAPADDPKIAISVVVENSGYGSTWAAPIASLMIEKYLNNDVKESWYKNKILNAKLLDRSEQKD